MVENLLNRVGKVGLALSLAWNLPTASGWARNGVAIKRTCKNSTRFGARLKGPGYGSLGIFKQIQLPELPSPAWQSIQARHRSSSRL